jgi:hypothetical protein
MTKHTNPKVLISAAASPTTGSADVQPEPAAPGQQELFSNPGAAGPVAEPNAEAKWGKPPAIPAAPACPLEQGHTIPKGFRPGAEPPKVGVRVLAILADGTPEFVTFEKLNATDPALLFSYGYRSRGGGVVVKCWRPIPSNWTE